MRKRLIHLLLTVAIFFYILFEELIWETIARPLYTYIHSLELLQKLQQRLSRFPAWVLLILFLFIFAQVEVVGLLSALMLFNGYPFIAVMLYLAKIPVAAFAFWLFRISEERLLTIKWFAKCYDFVMEKIAWIQETEIYRHIKTRAALLKEQIKQWKARYFPKGELKRKIKRIYLQLKKVFKKDQSR